MILKNHRPKNSPEAHGALVRPPFAYPKPPFAAAKRWRPPHPSLVLFAMMFMSACGGGGGNNTPRVSAPVLGIIPPNSDTAIATNGDGLLNENADATDAAHTANKNRIEIGRITDDKDPNGDAIYALTKNAPTTDNADFTIENNILYYVGDDAGDFEANPRAQYNIKIERYKNQEDATAESNPQTFDFIVNIKDLANSLTIALPSGDPIASGDEAGFLPENLDGSPSAGGRKLVGTITNASGTYRLTNHNDRFEIDGNQIFYIGTALDFDDPNTPKSFALNIEHTDSNNNKQTVEYIANLKDIAPDITAYEADGTTEIAEYIAADTLGDGKITMAFKLGAAGETLTIEFVYGPKGEPLLIQPKYADPDNPDPDEVVGFTITARLITFAGIPVALTDRNNGSFFNAANDIFSSTYPNAIADFEIWEDYLISVRYIGPDAIADLSAPPQDSLFTTRHEPLTARPRIVVKENTPISEIIANFAVADTATFSLAEIDDYADFTINQNTGALTFKTAPDFETPTDTDGDNFYKVTVTADDGTSTRAYDLLVQIEGVLDLINVNEGIATSETIADFDSDDAGTYSMGGTDAGLFDFATATGKLNFKNIPNFNDPRDANTDNIYQITVANSATSTITNVDIVVVDVENLIIVYEGTTSAIHSFATLNAEFVLSDDDANDFTITNGELKFAANSGDDVDNPDDGDGTNGDNRYEVTITVNGGNDAGIYNWTVLVVDTPPVSSSIAPSAEESLPSVAESIDGDDDFALPPWSHGMDDGEAVPNKTHLNEAYYAGSYDAYVDYLQFILDGGDPNVGGLLIGPSTDETLTPDADEPAPSPEEKPEQPKKLQAMLDAIGAAEQSAPAPDPHQWQPESYNDDSDLIDLPDTGPDIL